MTAVVAAGGHLYVAGAPLAGAPQAAPLAIGDLASSGA